MNSKTGSHFSIGEIQASDIGNYTCKAINSYGEDVKSESVIIEGMFMNMWYLYYKLNAFCFDIKNFMSLKLAMICLNLICYKMSLMFSCKLNI